MASCKRISPTATITGGSGAAVRSAPTAGLSVAKRTANTSMDGRGNTGMTLLGNRRATLEPVAFAACMAGARADGDYREY